MTGRKGEGAFCQEGLWVVKEIRKKKKKQPIHCWEASLQAAGGGVHRGEDSMTTSPQDGHQIHK